MTLTAPTTAPPAQPPSDRLIQRRFTVAGADVYASVPWGRRDARIGVGDDVAFEQAGVEFPTGWSDTAVNITASKYFRGAVGTPERESSLRELLDRVVDTVTAWGDAGGCFADSDEAEAFGDELRWLLLRQRAAFNSPVWFNIGVAGVPQQARRVSFSPWRTRWNRSCPGTARRAGSSRAVPGPGSTCRRSGPATRASLAAARLRGR